MVSCSGLAQLSKLIELPCNSKMLTEEGIPSYSGIFVRPVLMESQLTNLIAELSKRLLLGVSNRRLRVTCCGYFTDLIDPNQVRKEKKSSIHNICTTGER